MEPAVYWHRTLGDIVNELISCDFRIKKKMISRSSRGQASIL